MPEELDEASEVFLCGTAAELVPVGAIDDRRYQVGPMTRALMEVHYYGGVTQYSATQLTARAEQALATARRPTSRSWRPR